jgi:AcrR family transcriptional regulator
MVAQKQAGNHAARGRPREFDTEQALASAMHVFWEKSYAGASLTDLTEAMGITRPSLYAAFGNKDALFKQAFDLYENDQLAYFFEALEAPTVRDVVRQMLAGTIENVSGDSRGCLGVTALVSCNDANPDVQQTVQARVDVFRDLITKRFQRSIEEGEFEKESTSAEAMALYLMAVLQGLSIQAGAGASREQLRGAAEATLAVWPSA